MRNARVFISHSSHDDKWATECRRNLILEIGQMSGYKALVDEVHFEAGDLWRPTLYQWLSIADAAILLLSREALASPWVRKEATILMWRRDLGSGIRVIPALLGVQMSDVREQWPSIEIDESHAVHIELGAEPRRVVEQILSGFDPVPESNDVLTGWTDRVAGLLLIAHEAYLWLGAAELGLERDDPRLGALHTRMSHALLHSDILRAELSLRQTADGLGTSLAPLVRLVTPVSVPLDVAEPVSRAMARPPGRRIAIVPAKYSDTGPRVADRATCSNRKIIKVSALCVGVENSAQFIYDGVVQSVSQTIGVPPGEPLTRNDTEAGGSILLALRYSPSDGVTIETLREVVAKVTTEYPAITIIVLTGSNDAETALDIDIPGAVIAPPLAYSEERAGYMAAKRLFDLTMEN